MRFFSTLLLAARRLRRRPVRSFLLLQGTVWGVAVAIFPAAVLLGTRQAALTQGSEFGADRIAVAIDPTGAQEQILEPKDLEVVRRGLDGAGITYEALGAMRVRPDSVTVALPEEGAKIRNDFTLVAGTPDLARARGLSLSAGRWLRADDPHACVVEAQVAAQLGRKQFELGERLLVDSISRVIVGITTARTREALRVNDMGFDIEHPLYESVASGLLVAMGVPSLAGDEWKRSDACVHIPLAGAAAVDWIQLRVDPTGITDAAQAVREAMTGAQKTVLTLHPFALPLVLGKDVERFNAVGYALFLACLAMGAIVMANLGLLTVLGRAREIAIRRVEGASRVDIALHFILEGMLLTIIGCLLGCGLGMLLAELRANLEPSAGFTWAFPWKEGLIACAVAFVVGLLATGWPAIRASFQDPVEGLVDE